MDEKKVRSVLRAEPQIYGRHETAKSCASGSAELHELLESCWKIVAMVSGLRASMRSDRNKRGTTWSRSETDLNCAVHIELRGLVSAEGESARCGRCGERDNRHVDKRAIVAEDCREVNEAYRPN